MPPIISEILKLSLREGFKLDSPHFAQLRALAVASGVKEQYYGTCQIHPNTLMWVIQWPANKGPLQSQEFRKGVDALDATGRPSTWLLPFGHESLPRPALTAPVTELVFLHIKPSADQKALAHSLNKTFTDCYLADGFVGGHWATATNDDRMHWYVLGWESREMHKAYTETELFAVEIDILSPQCDDSGPFFMNMTQELS